MKHELANPFCVALWFTESWGDVPHALAAVEAAMGEDRAFFLPAGSSSLGETIDGAGVKWTGTLLVITGSSLFRGTEINQWIRGKVSEALDTLESSVGGLGGCLCASWPLPECRTDMRPSARATVLMGKRRNVRLNSFALPEGLADGMSVAKEGCSAALKAWNTEGPDVFPAWWAHHRFAGLEARLGHVHRPSPVVRL